MSAPCMCLSAPDIIRMDPDKVGQDMERDASHGVTVLCHLYNLQLVHCQLIFDLIKVLCEAFSEVHIDLLLRVLTSGLSVMRYCSF